MPTISVVITSHNRQREVVRAIRSVAGQTLPALEIIVVDDASSPALSAVELAPQQQLPLRLIRHEQARGPGGARNAGIRAAKGEFVAFLDDDDQFVPEKLARCTVVLDQHAEASVLHHAAYIDMINEGVGYTTHLEPHDGGAGLYRRLLVKNIVGGTPMVVARREALATVGGFDEGLAALEDYDLWLRLARAGYRFVALPEPLTRYDCVTARRSVTKSDAAGADTFARILAKHASARAALTAAEQLEQRRCVAETELQRALLRLDRHDAIARAWALWRLQPTLRATLAFVTAVTLGPRAMIRLRAARG